MAVYIQKLDERILNIINKYCRNQLLDRIMPAITDLGNLGIIWIIISLFLLKIKMYKEVGIMILSGISLSTILSEGIIKHIVHRSRPCDEIKPDNLLIQKPLSYSFPSGHTASSFTAAGILDIMIKQYGLYAMILAALIAFSRIYLLVHYPSDIIAGIVLGLICSIIIVSVFMI
jgi:undecaprenyl-diphosphatase